jgi:DNA repair protein RadD
MTCANNYMDHRANPIPLPGTLPPTHKVEPRDYQGWMYQAIAAGIRNYTGPFFVEASVGAGKTITMGMVLSRIQQTKAKALVLARAGELCEQNAAAFWDCGVKNSIYSASLGIKSKHYDIIVGTEGTVVNALFNKDELDEFKPDYILIDECHEVPFDDLGSQYMRIILELIERNPKIKIIGFTGTPYRNNMDLTGDFWKQCVYRIKSKYLVDRGYLVPDIFGVGDDSDIKYDLSEFAVHGDDDREDYSFAELSAMEEKILASEEITRDIVAKVLVHSESRNCVLITGAGLKHLQQIAKYLPSNSWGIVTSSGSYTSAGEAKRRDILKDAFDGKIKYLLQVACLITGVDIPLIDTSVIMRRIASLRILEQLMGRGKRLLKPFQIEAGYVKHDHLILDYTETFEAMHEMYCDPVLEAYVAKKDEEKKVELIACPVCETRVSPRARRCSNRPIEIDGKQRLVRVEGGVLDIENYSIDGRCEWFFADMYVACKECNTPNDRMARDCRQCGHTLIDPNKNLVGKHYTDSDWREVKSMSMRLTSNGEGLLVSYLLEGEPAEGAKVWDGHEQATELFWPSNREKWAQGMWADFKRKHCHKDWHPRINGKSAKQILAQQAIFDKPVKITHRINAKGNSVIHRKEFSSGRVVE